MNERTQRINGVSRKIMLFLSLVALLTVLTGYTSAPQQDEGTGAHIFQLSIVLLAPTILLFFVTADWSRPVHSARPLALAAVFVALAFGALYYLEHVWFPNHTPHGQVITPHRPRVL
jgi:hypothetical protein